MLLERPDAVVAHHADDGHPVAHERVELEAGEAEGAVAEQEQREGVEEVEGRGLPEEVHLWRRIAVTPEDAHHHQRRQEHGEREVGELAHGPGAIDAR